MTNRLSQAGLRALAAGGAAAALAGVGRDRDHRRSGDAGVVPGYQLYGAA